jgi:hypothetical protein
MSASMITVLTTLMVLVTRSPAMAQKAEEWAKNEMTFTLIDTSGICTDCSVVQASGYIRNNTSDAFHSFIEKEQLKQDVYFIVDSFGGDMKNAVGLGFKLRELKATTVVGHAVVRDSEIEIEPASCLSACVPAFLGGTARNLPKNSGIGVHSWMPAELSEKEGREVSTPRRWDQATIEQFYRQVAAYLYFLEHMGIDLRLATRVFGTPHDDMYFVGPYEQREWNVTTIGSITAEPLDRDLPILVLRRSIPPLLTRGPRTSP